MASIGHQASAAEPRINGISRLAATTMHPAAAFSNALSPSDYRERYVMESHPYRIRSSSPLPLNRSGPGKTVANGYQQQQQMHTEASSPIWQRHASTGSDMISHHQHHHDATTHLHSVENSRISGGPGGGSSSRVSAMLGITSPDSVSRGSPAASRQSSTSELYEVSGGTPSVSGGDWPPLVDSGMQYKMSSLSLLSQNSPTTEGSLQQQQRVGAATGYKEGNFGGVNEGAIICELIGRLGGGSSAGTLASTSPPPIPSHHVTAAVFGGRLDNNGQHMVGFKLGGGTNHNNWSPAVAAAAATGVEMMAGNVGSLIVDPSKGGLSLNSCVAGRNSSSPPLSSSRCLSPFSTDPGFAERAARFSSFNNNNGNYTQQQNFSSTTEGEGGAKTLRSRSNGGAASSLSESSSKQFSGNTTSGCPLPSSSRDRELSAGDPTSGTSNCPRSDRHTGHIVVENSHIASSRVVAAAESTLCSGGRSENKEIEEDPVERDSAERNRGLMKINSSPSTLPVKSFAGTALSCRNPLMSTTNIVDQDEGQEGGRCSTSAANEGSSNPAGRIRGILTSNLLDRQQQHGAAPSASVASREICHSSAGESNYTMDTLAKKRKLDIDVRPNVTSDVAGSTSSSRGDRDDKVAMDADESKGKRLRRGDGGSKEKEEGSVKAAAAERSGSETSGETSPRSTTKKFVKPVEPPKPDYIHVRARRGQATDSHSLAERVRREKISERMKFLQDLVPGCSKVTGKATMLDEIINYVQSLQCQVEFLSMKLASVSPRLDFNPEGPHPGAPGIGLGSEVGCSIPYPPMQQPQHQVVNYQLHSNEAALRRSCLTVPPVPSPVPAVSPRIDGFGDSGHASSGPALWDGELQSIVQIGLGQSPSTASTPSSHCHLPPGQVKVELQQSAISCL